MQRRVLWLLSPHTRAGPGEVPYDRERLAQDLMVANQKVEDLRRLVAESADSKALTAAKRK